MNSAVRQEFFRWIASTGTLGLTDYDLKLLNLFSSNFEILEPLGTAKGSNNRAAKLNELVQKHHETLSTDLPAINSQQASNTERFDRITELNIGPFRGFTVNESFTFEKKYTFMYGPNGSGKSSFCEGLEYALLGGIEEADVRRIGLAEYIKNYQKNSAVPPVAYSVNAAQQKIAISPNQALYRFAFVEKNRIDGFARITSTTSSAQKSRIATLFGLDAFSTFVDGFTDDIDKYIIPPSTKADKFKAESQKYETDKTRINTINSDLSDNAGMLGTLLKEVAQKDVATAEALRVFLSGIDGVSGHINELQKQKAEQLPLDLKTDLLDSLPIVLSHLNSSLQTVDKDLNELCALSADVNFKDLYDAIDSISKIPDNDVSFCPACKTPISQVVINPYEKAILELKKLGSLSELQSRIPETCNLISGDVRTAISNIKSINELCTNSSFSKTQLSSLSEFVFTNISDIENWKPRLETELKKLENCSSLLDEIRLSVHSYNTTLAAKREKQLTIDTELQKFQTFNTRLLELCAKENTLIKEREAKQKETSEFETANADKIKEIEEEKKKLTVHEQYAAAYKRLISHLKKTRDQLPSKLSEGLSQKVKEYYNTINTHDPDFELLNLLTLPATPGAKLEIKFKGDDRVHDALLVLSEGHIKVLGLSILLAKAVNEDLGFLIFDDIVNAIDDDHRGGISELLLGHADLKNRQHILTCHGETFINKLEHKLGKTEAGKNVKSYRFIPADTQTTRGVQVTIGDSKHYILKAKEALVKNSLKDSATDCRRAVESVSYQLWKKLDKQLKINLKVTMRAPGVLPDIATVVDSLIKELKSITGTDNLRNHMTALKEKYPWSLLNKGVHEDEDQPEFERKDITELIALIESVESEVLSFKLSSPGLAK